jgi:outer membrane biosynthesis protein TonB
MTARSLSREESLGLALALVGHAALVAWLIWQRDPAPLPMPERMSVTISDQTGPVSAAPIVQPEEAAPDTAPVLGEAPPPPVPQPQIAPPQPQRPSPIAAPPKPPVKPTTTQKLTKPGQKPGGSAFDNAFAGGVPGATGKAKTPPASVASAQQVSAWSSLIGSKVRGPWNSCPVSGLDVQSLRAVVRFSLNRDGSVAAIDEPQVTGITASNQPQVRPFRDCAVRAIKLAAPFPGLPPEFYDSWKLRRLTFSKRD